MSVYFGDYMDNSASAGRDEAEAEYLENAAEGGEALHVRLETNPVEFIEGGYKDVQQMIQRLKDEYPEAAGSLHMLSLKLWAVTIHPRKAK